MAMHVRSPLSTLALVMTTLVWRSMGARLSLAWRATPTYLAVSTVQKVAQWMLWILVAAYAIMLVGMVGCSLAPYEDEEMLAVICRSLSFWTFVPWSGLGCPCCRCLHLCLWPSATAPPWGARIMLYSWTHWVLLVHRILAMTSERMLWSHRVFLILH